MKDAKKTIIIPCDFTEVCQFALDYAVRISRILGTDFTLVHIVDEGGMFANEEKKKKEVEAATKKLEEIAEKTYLEHNERPKIIARIGNIYSTINEIAEELEARLVMMGIHEFKGMQKLTGSHALKVIAGSKIPYIAIAASYIYRADNDIVFPVDHKVENKEKLVWANYMAKNFNSKMHIITPNFSDELLKKKVNANLIFAKKYLDEKGIRYEIATAKKGKNFADAVVEFAKEVNTNLILIMITKEIGFQDFLLGADEQKIIFNDAKISVMCVNPRIDLRRSGGFN
ncbi:MAG: universal stress protein [Bacteroidota bacterium]|nr:universal stress protein [Bacteroidota bacterium]